MANLSHFANTTTLLDGQVMDPPAWFTMASVFTQQSGLAMLSLSTTNRGLIFLSSHVHFASDDLSAAGYHCVTSCRPDCSQVSSIAAPRQDVLATFRIHQK
jgi:hypothetical protein